MYKINFLLLTLIFSSTALASSKSKCLQTAKKYHLSGSYTAELCSSPGSYTRSCIEASLDGKFHTAISGRYVVDLCGVDANQETLNCIRTARKTDLFGGYIVTTCGVKKHIAYANRKLTCNQAEKRVLRIFKKIKNDYDANIDRLSTRGSRIFKDYIRNCK